uniref:Uncharacterized protein n=1 Tax=Strongyloides stercoralis TaxID=6248 RepID=A0A0K0ERP7_STRER
MNYLTTLFLIIFIFDILLISYEVPISNNLVENVEDLVSVREKRKVKRKRSKKGLKKNKKKSNHRRKNKKHLIKKISEKTQEPEKPVLLVEPW